MKIKTNTKKIKGKIKSKQNGRKRKKRKKLKKKRKKIIIKTNTRRKISKQKIFTNKERDVHVDDMEFQKNISRRNQKIFGVVLQQ